MTTHTAQAHTAEPVAWLKEWIIDGELRRRVDLSEESDKWMMSLDVKVTPLFAGDPSEALRACREALEAYARAEGLSLNDRDKPEDWEFATKLRIAALATLTPKGAA